MPTRLIDVTLSTDTNAYANGDVIAETQVVTGALVGKQAAGVLESVTVIDADDQGAAFDIYFLESSGSMGTENGAPGIVDADAAKILAIVPIATGDYKDLGGSKVANIKNIRAVLQAGAQSEDIYVAVVNGSGTPTYSAAGLKLRIGITQ